jgi:hypothetical protein
MRTPSFVSLARRQFRRHPLALELLLALTSAKTWVVIGLAAAALPAILVVIDVQRGGDQL